MIEILKNREEILMNKKSKIDQDIQKYIRLAKDDSERVIEIKDKLKQLTAEKFNISPRLSLYSNKEICESDTKSEVLHHINDIIDHSFNLTTLDKLKLKLKTLTLKSYYWDTYKAIYIDECNIAIELLNLSNQNNINIKTLNNFGSKEILSKIIKIIDIDTAKIKSSKISISKLIFVGSLAAIGTVLYHILF